MHGRTFWLTGGLLGLAGILCYGAAIFVSWPETQAGTSISVLIVTGFPVFCIVYWYALFDLIRAERDSAANHLSLLFAVAAFATVLAMVLVQVAVVTGFPEVSRGMDQQNAQILRRGLRLVDMGLDVAWDFLGCAAIICLGIAMRGHPVLRRGWAPIAIILAVALIGLNAATFPWPPANRGLFDLGPFVALFLAALAVRVVLFARARPPAAGAPPAPVPSQIGSS